MRSPRDRLKLFGGRPKGLFPLTDGRFDHSKDFSGVAEFAAGHPLPPVVENATTPFVGITVDGTAQPGLHQLADEIDTRDIVAAATRFAATLSTEQQAVAVWPLEAPQWRMWSNAFPDWDPHGICLQHVGDGQRNAAMEVVAQTLSETGYAITRDLMRLNAALGELIDDYHDTLTEWMYFFALFGHPSKDQPWGWQLWGHHLDLSCLVLGRQVALTPMFMGAEPCFADGEDGHGISVLQAERQVGLQMFDALSAAQRSKATLYPSMRTSDLPHAINGAINGRHLAGAGEDNLVLPYQGVCADELSPGQREALIAVCDPYLDRMPGGAREAKRAAIERHLDNTWFAWIGDGDRDGANYYRVQSPVVLIEYDNHPGVFLNNPEPEPFHIHTVVRTPNGNDYGKDLLRQHYARHHRTH
ncbi:DUF3500 domain-containing protein [Mycolicibacterium sp. CBM1]